MSELRKWVTTGKGNLQLRGQEGFRTVGKFTTGVDAQGRAKLIVNVDGNTYSGFVEAPPVSRNELEEFAAWKKHKEEVLPNFG